MIEKINVEQSTQMIKIENGIKNFDQLEKQFKKQAIKIKETIIDEENYKLMKKELDTLLEPAKVIRKIAAAFNKEGEAAIKVTYEKMKEIEEIVRSEVNAKKEEISQFEEARKQKMLKNKKEDTQEILNNCNEQIAHMQAHLLTFNQIEFQDDWATWSIERIEKAIQEAYNTEHRRHKDATTRMKLAELKCKELKSDYELETDINYISVLGDTIYENENWEADLESEAEKLQIQQEELREKIEEKARLEAENKFRKEQLEKEKKQLEEQKMFTDKLLIEKEPEHNENELEMTKEDYEKEKNIEINKSYNFILELQECSLEKANDLKNFLEENSFKFKLVPGGKK